MILRAGARRSRQDARREPPELGLLAGESLGRGLRRMAVEQADLAIALLAEPAGALHPEAVHEVRKALKRMRALLRLLEGELPGAVRRRENRALRDLGRRLSGARDTEVMLDTLRALIERHPRTLRRKGIVRLERRLLLERESVRARTLTDAAMRGEVVARLRAFRACAAGWELRERGASRLVEPGVRRIYSTGRRRYRRVERGRGKRTRALHQWRKSVKDLRYAGEMLSARRRPAGPHDGNGRAAPAPVSAARGGKGDAARTRRLRRIARRADDLGELLGEEHDLALLAELVGTRAPLGVPMSRGNRRRLRRAIARRRRQLRVRALRAGDELYARSPKRTLRVVRRELARRAVS